MWLGIVSGLINLLEKAGEYALVKLLRQHSDALLACEVEIAQAQADFLNDTDNRDDVEWVHLIHKRILLEQALAREVVSAQSVKVA